MLAAALLFVWVGCGDKKVKKRRSRRSQGGSAEPAMAANLQDVGKPSAEVAARKRPSKKDPRSSGRVGGSGVALPKADEFTERDFVENEQESRDPFRNLLIKQPTKAEPKLLDQGDIVYLKDYPLAELRVSGIVGSRRRFAMVRDPRTGRTTILKKRDRVGTERALIFEIKRDHLVLLVPRLRPDQADPYERKTLYVDETRKIVDISTDPIRPDESGIRVFGRRRRPGADRGKER
jgi:hypothetical protein